MNGNEDEQEHGRAGGSGFDLPESDVVKRDREQRAAEAASWREMRIAAEHLRKQGTQITRVTIRGKWVGAVDILVILCADTDDGPVVAFHGSENAMTLWTRLARRIMNGTLKWRPDDDG